MINVLDLNGTWKLRWADGQRNRPEYATRDQTDPDRYLDATVPGEVHLDLLRHGLIADPCVGINCLAARWVEECLWSYRRELDVPPDALRGRSWLVFEGLDCIATIILNGQEVGRHQNTFYPCRIEVTGKLRPGRNILTVHLDSGLYYVGEKTTGGYLPFQSIDQYLHKRHWLRKPQCQFSWDWSTRLINVGIHGPVRLEWTTDPARLDQLVPLVEVSNDLRKGSIAARLFVEGLGAEPVAGRLTVQLVETGQSVTADVQIKPGLNPVEATLHVDRPELWWPVGHGSQALHTLSVTLSIDGKVVGRRTARIGFRHVRVNQDPHPQTGRYFTIEINGRKIFAKGGNSVPADMIFARADRHRYDALTDLALEANFNFLRVWGGGLYESDDFYDLCDRKGILVWQEFIYACARYPLQDEAFAADVKAEAVHNVRRLASHPSLVVWCGNNEMEWGHWEWNYDKKGVIAPDYAMFHLFLPRILKAEDPTRYYQPSSPWSPEGVHPNADHIGDQHPWSVGMHNDDFRRYRDMICRFPNEGGILGPNALPTLRACLPPGHERPHSFAWDIHENSVDTWAEPSLPDQMIRTHLGKAVREMTLEQYAYWAGLVQGEGLREYVDNFHRRMFDTSSAIFWMYNDTWPTTRSWTIIDYYLRRTPAFHPVRRAMSPVHVVVTRQNDRVLVHGINETRETVRARLRYGLFKLAGGYPLDEQAEVQLLPNASTVLASFPADRWIDPTSSLAFATLERGGDLIARNRLFLPLFREMAWPAAAPAVRLDAGRAVFQSPTFAWGVCIDLDGEQPLPDNFFDIYPGIAYSIPWPSAEPPRILGVGNLT